MKSEKRRKDLAEANRRYYEKQQADPEKREKNRAKKRAAWRRRTPEQIERDRETARAWTLANKDKIKEYKKKDHEKHKERRYAMHRDYYQKNKVAIIAKARAVRLENHECHLRMERDRRAANPKYREMNRRHREKFPYRWRFYSVQSRAKRGGLAFDLDPAWFKEKVEAGICELSGLPFDLRGRKGLGSRYPNAPSVDRINPKGGYTKDNCRMILWWLNRCFADLGQDYCLGIFRAVLVKRGEIAEYEDRMAA